MQKVKRAGEFNKLLPKVTLCFSLQSSAEFLFSGVLDCIQKCVSPLIFSKSLRRIFSQTSLSPFFKKGGGGPHEKPGGFGGGGVGVFKNKKKLPLLLFCFALTALKHMYYTPRLTGHCLPLRRGLTSLPGLPPDKNPQA